MTRKAKIWSITALVLVLWLLLAWFLPQWLAVQGRARLVVAALLALIGIVTAVFSAIYASRRPPAPPPPPDALSQEVESAFRLVESRLAESGLVRRRAIQRMPVVLVLGDRQQVKTSTVVRSGARAELLAGTVLDGGRVVPTSAINIWLARPALIVEPSVDVLQDANRRARLWHLLQPARLADAVTRGEQAPRAALLCVGLDQLRTPGAGANCAREMRQTIEEIARRFGVRLPVYVAFTKLDVIAGFKEFGGSLTTDEVQQVLGATFPLAPEMLPSAYGEFATTRARSAFRAIVDALGERRHAILERLNSMRDRAAAYEFPRELAKLEGELVSFLVELVRPSELQISPIARGFYFSGYREVIVPELIGGSAPLRDARLPEPDEGATALLRAVGRPGASAAPGGIAGAPAERREVEWTFLERLFSGVLLDDPVAFDLTRGGARVSYFRRWALGVALGVVAMVLLGICVSFARNVSLAQRVEAQLAAARALPVETMSEPTTARLLLLDSLGASLDEVSQQVHEGPPLSFRWGLSVSPALYPLVREAYFRNFHALLFASTNQHIIQQLQGLPAEALGGEEYRQTYDRLMSHLVLTQYHDSATAEFLARTLTDNWPGTPSADSLGKELATRQFDRFAREHHYEPVFPREPDASAVAAARAALAASAGELAIYQGLIESVNRRVPQFVYADRQASRATRTITVPATVPGAFTRRGFDSVSVALTPTNVRELLQPAIWVVGPNARRTEMSADTLVRVLERRYDGDYAEAWRRLMRSANVNQFSNLKQATERLGLLASNNSELLLLMALENENMPSDSTRVARWFKPVRQLGSPTARGVLTTEGMKEYQNALQTLAQKVSSAAMVTDVATGKPVYADASAAALQVIGQAQALSRAFEPEEWDGSGLQRLLEQPAKYASALLDDANRESDRAGAAGTAEDDGGAYCQKIAPLLSKRPFASAGKPVTATELSEVFGPNSPLRGLERAVRDTRRSSPDADEFLKRMRLIANTLYGGGNEAVLQFTIKPDGPDESQSARIRFGRNAVEWRAGEPKNYKSVTWNFAADDGITIESLRSGANSTELFGEWAIIEFFRGAREWTQVERGYRFRDENDRVGLLRVEMTPSVAAAVHGDLFRTVPACPSKWTR